MTADASPYRHGPPEPARIARLPRDRIGRPVPWFVAWVEGVPDFRIVKPGAAGAAWTGRFCWVCGIAFARQEPRAFVVGPMCAVNRVSSEPPSHYDCAAFSAVACPFLANPSMVRRDRHLPEGVTDPPGDMIARNPGVALVWVAKYNAPKITRPPGGGILFDIGAPEWVEWYAYGRAATRTEVLASIDSGLPALRDLAGNDPDALRALDEYHRRALALVPR